jgi:hypothetical protein
MIFHGVKVYAITHQHYSPWQVLQVSHVARKCRMLLTSVACCSQVLQVSNKAYFHDDDTKETLKMPQTLDLKKEEWITGDKNLLPPERSI